MKKKIKQALILTVILFAGIYANAQTKSVKTKQANVNQTKSKVAQVSPVVVCPNGLTLVDGNCVKKVMVNGRQVWVGCWGGKIVYHEIVGDRQFGPVVTGPSSGQACSGTWEHKTNL